MDKKKEDKSSEKSFKQSVSSKAKNSSPNRVLYKQHYRKVWETLPEFSGWLEADPKNAARAFCTVCSKNLHAHRLTLLKHTASIKHMKRAQQQYEAKQLMAGKKTNITPDKEGMDENGVGDTEENCELPLDCSTNMDKQDDCNKRCADESDVEAPVAKMVEVTEAIDETGNSNSNPTNTRSSSTPLAVVKPPISTHVLDTTKGLPVSGLPVSLYKLVEGRWTYIKEAFTNPDGRCSDLIARDDVEPGRFKLHFDTDRYYELRKNDRLYPFIEIVFDLHSPTEHVHIPLLMNPYSYTTYKGS